MLKSRIGWCAAVGAAFILSSTAFAAGPIAFGAASVTGSQQRTAPVAEQVPGVNRAVLAPVTPEESERAIQSRVLPRVLNPGIRAKSVAPERASAQRVVGDAAASAPASIAELARALRNNPDLIYEYVRNNIEYVPIWGVQKGALGTILDNQGTAFDQATLMVELLRQSGYTAGYVRGRINLTAAQVTDWLGVDTTKVCSISKLLGLGQIPITSITATAAGSCPGTTAALVSIKMDHVWVKVNIGGTNYYFDPSFKPHRRTTGVDLAAATGYNASSFLTSAMSGATVTADYVQNVSRTNVRSNLTTYASNLASYLRTNKPAGTLDDVVGGMTIIPYAGGNVRQAVLSYQDTSAGVTEWTDIPASYKPTLRIQYQGIDATYTSDAIYGKRLTITYNGSSQPVLMLDGAVLGTGSAVTPGSSGPINLTVTHSAYADPGANQAFSQTIKAGGTFVIANAWGPAGRGAIELHRSRLEEARANGVADGAESTLGSVLAQLGANWITQNNQNFYVHGRLSRTSVLFHHQVGIAGYNTAPFVDLPGNVLSVVNQDDDATKELAMFFSGSMHSSVLESTAVQQTSGTSAVSTVKLVDMAAQAGDKIFNATSANYASAVQPYLTGCSGASAGISNFLSAGRRLVLPARCNLNEGTWTGYGYYAILVNGASYGLAAVIDGGLAGGAAVVPTPPATVATAALDGSKSFPNQTAASGQIAGDPIDMVRGNFLYAHDDMVTGVGAFPYSLTFNRLYSSSVRNRSGPLGKGWTHNFAITASQGSDGLQAMGEDSALDAAAAIAEIFVSLDLMADTAAPVNKMVVATLGQRWYGEQLVNNTVTVTQGLNGETFVKLPDGSYNAPPGSSAKLSVSILDNTYTYETANKAKLNFDTTGKVKNYMHPSGVQVNFTYSGNDLSQVANSLGRSLAFTTTSGRVTNVSDGSRNIQYAYDGNANLTTYTDATAAATSFQYDLPGRITKFFYPSNPSIAFATNVYDSLGRVQTQTDANGKLYTYYFAGTRTEEIGPLSLSRVTYLDANGRALKSISPTGKTTLNTYDGQTRLVKTVLPEGNSVEYEYDDMPCSSPEGRCTHNIKTIRQLPKPGSGLPTLTRSFTYEGMFNQVFIATDARGQSTSYTYSPWGQVVMVTGPAVSAGVQPVTTYGYTSFAGGAGFPSFNLQTSVTQKISATSTIQSTTSYNNANKYVPWMVTVDAGSLNLTKTLTHDSVGNLTSIDGPRMDVLDIERITYDAERRPTQKSIDALTGLTRTGYDADGRVTRTAAQWGPSWLVSCRSYTPSGKLLKVWGPAMTSADTTCPTAAAPVPVVDYAYDDLDRLLRTTQNLTVAEGGNRLSEFVYNLDGSVASELRATGTPLAQTYAAYTYSDNGLVLTSKDARNNLTTNQYDGHDRLLQRRFPDPVTANTSSATDYEQYAYDANANPTSVRKRNGQSVTLVYDNLNRLTSRSYPTTADNVSYTYDLLGRRLTASGATAADNVDYVYDKAGRLTSTTANGRTLSYQYDAAGNRTRMTWPDTAFFTTTTYDALNRPLAIMEQSTLVTYAYDDLGRRNDVVLGNGTRTMHGYDSQSMLLNRTLQLSGPDGNTYSFNRNQAGEITTLNWSNDSYQWAGVLGNATNGTRSYSANGLNQYTTAAGATQTHDGNGNLAGDGTWTYGYDLNNRLKTASKSGISATLAYDAEGRLRQSVITGTTSETTNLLYDGMNLVAEYDAAGTLLRRYVHGAGVDEPLVVYEGATTTTKNWFHTDHQGSVVATTDATRARTAVYSYGPYGEPNTLAGQRFRYTGQQLIGGLGLYYYKARFYSPGLGRFLQTDPIGTADDLNLYAYVGNNPVNFTDSTGLYAVSSSGGGGGGCGGSGCSAATTATLTSSGEADAGDVQVAWISPEDMINNKRRPLLEGGGGAGLGGGGGTTLKPGPFARESIPGHMGKPTAEEQRQVNILMEKNGCHTCGTKDPGTKSRNAVVDHQPPQALDETTRFLPHCIDCMRRQGGETLQELIKRGGS